MSKFLRLGFTCFFVTLLGPLGCGSSHDAGETAATTDTSTAQTPGDGAGSKTKGPNPYGGSESKRPVAAPQGDLFAKVNLPTLPERPLFKEAVEVFDKYPNGLPKIKAIKHYYTDDVERYHGEYTEWWKNGKVFKRGQWRNGFMVGQWKYFHDNGKPSKVVQYTDRGRPDGEWTLYREDGTMESKRHFAAGKKHGQQIEYGPSGEKPVAQQEFKNGLYHGSWISWYPSGRKKSEVHWLEGKRHGTSTYWHENGQKSGQAELRNGKQHGELITWNDEGVETRRVKFRDGERID